MKAVVIGFMLLLTSVVANAQEFHVVGIKGNVKLKGGTAVKVNDKLKGDDQLIFSSDKDAVAVVGAKAGRFVITPSPKSKDGEFLSIVKNALTPGVKKLSTRSGLFNNALDITQYFKEPVLLLPELRYQMSKTGFPMDDKSFFFIRYTYRGEGINKRLKFSGDTLVISRAELFSVDRKPINAAEVTGYQLFYITAGKGAPIANISLVTPEPSELTQALEATKASMKGKSKAEVGQEVLDFFNDFYGKTDERNFQRWYGAQ